MKEMDTYTEKKKKAAAVVRAFEVEVKDWYPKQSGIYAATTPAKAKFQAFQAAHDAGYDLITFGQLRVRRAPEFDGIAGQLRNGVEREWACLLRQQEAARGDAESKILCRTEPPLNFGKMI